MTKRTPPARRASGYTVRVEVLLRAGPGPERVTVPAPGIARAIRLTHQAFPDPDTVVVLPLDQKHFFNPTAMPPGLHDHDGKRRTSDPVRPHDAREDRLARD